MDVICDIETNIPPTKIYLVICKDVDNEKVYTFRDVGPNETGLAALREFGRGVRKWIGHNFLGFDRRWLADLAGVVIDPRCVLDTLVLSHLFEGTRTKHSLESWGETLGIKKVGADLAEWGTFTPLMEDRCRSDVEINYALYKRFLRLIQSPTWAPSIRTEHYIAHLTNTLHDNGFAFAYPEAVLLKKEVDKELSSIDSRLLLSFPKKVVLLKEITPKGTTHGTISRVPFKFLGANPDLSPYTIGAPFSRIDYVDFNPASPSQIVERLNAAGWQPFEKTKGHREAEKALQQAYRKPRSPYRDEEITNLRASLAIYGATGWSISEENLKTLPDTAPPAAKELVQRLLLASRSSTLQTWLDAYNHESKRIHGRFHHIGAWTHRMSHANPNMGNIPKFDAKQPAKTPYSDRMRALWCAGRGRYLVGVDAESIQLRILAHYIDDPEFTKAIISGRKEDGTDPHSLNQRALGTVCKSRDDAKTFIYAWLLGAGKGKVANILGCSAAEAAEADKNFLDRYPGLRYLKDKVIPNDAARGYFQGFDGRYVRIIGDDISARSHYALAGYLQCGEVTIMKRAVEIWYPQLTQEGVPFTWVNFVHDEWQTETPRDMEIAEYVARTQAAAIQRVGDDLNLRCPMAGSILNAHGKLAIGDNWMQTH